ncbi:hypothetical protein BDK51DRAFT_44271 [Blyttiomyces helicus]|uniref:Uncharacterized protein n=1 Tax=Blyttiomyces helicus TaxID=388810 RepID=A0A4P9WE76_9FUNG|nr:hypothetical protein BDK51DRAFT_44271 [Blyttiomyces helicus]|eukprot:RKO91019.1 hypothetical protein BDK51DRAFT_44271 [Blyttiomyces helicus]
MPHPQKRPSSPARRDSDDSSLTDLPDSSDSDQDSNPKTRKTQQVPPRKKLAPEDDHSPEAVLKPANQTSQRRPFKSSYTESIEIVLDEGLNDSVARLTQVYLSKETYPPQSLLHAIIKAHTKSLALCESDQTPVTPSATNRGKAQKPTGPIHACELFAVLDRVRALHGSVPFEGMWDEEGRRGDGFWDLVGRIWNCMEDADVGSVKFEQSRLLMHFLADILRLDLEDHLDEPASSILGASISWVNNRSLPRKLHVPLSLCAKMFQTKREDVIEIREIAQAWLREVRLFTHIR